MVLNYEEIIERIVEEKGIPKDEVEAKIKEKLNQLSDLISKDGAAYIIANEYNINLYPPRPETKLKVNQLSPDNKNVTINLKVLKIYEVRSFKRNNEDKKVASFLAGDETGKIRVTLWDENLIKLIEDKKINENDIVTVSGAYVRKNMNGFNELHTGGAAKIEINPEGLAIEVKESSSLKPTHLNELKENQFAMIIGTVVHMFEPRFYELCTKCGKKKDNCQCETPAYGYAPIANFYLDDGTDNIRVVAFRDQVKQLFNVDSDQIQRLREDQSSFENIKKTVLGTTYKVLGRSVKNEQFERIEFIANDIQIADPKEILRLIENDEKNTPGD